MANLVDADVIAAYAQGGKTCIQVFFFRNGRNYGNKSYFPQHDRHCSVAEILEAFIGQFYASRTPPKEIYLSHKPQEMALLEQALSKNLPYNIHFKFPKKGPKSNLVQHAINNAEGALGRYLANKASQTHLLEGVAKVFDMNKTLERIEIYDNSHLQGVYAYGAMVVAGPEGFIKRAYRKFRIANDPSLGKNNALKGLIKGGDDYEMMRQVLRRRFHRTDNTLTLPDLVLLDGGQGQLNVALEIFKELDIKNVTLVAIAKGPDRNAGKERFFMMHKPPFQLSENDPILYYLQRLRDEAHRFAITTHRTKRMKDMYTSPLEAIPGIGAQRQRALLRYFGSAKAVTQAGIRDLEIVPGISKSIAKKIYHHFHHD
jgi:excinuclease ABC subunit C